MQYQYDIIDEEYNIVASYIYEEHALRFCEIHKQYSYVRNLKPIAANLQRLWDLS